MILHDFTYSYDFILFYIILHYFKRAEKHRYGPIGHVIIETIRYMLLSGSYFFMKNKKFGKVEGLYLFDKLTLGYRYSLRKPTGLCGSHQICAEAG